MGEEARPPRGKTANTRDPGGEGSCGVVLAWLVNIPLILGTFGFVAIGAMVLHLGDRITLRGVVEWTLMAGTPVASLAAVSSRRPWRVFGWFVPAALGTLMQLDLVVRGIESAVLYPQGPSFKFDSTHGHLVVLAGVYGAFLAANLLALAVKMTRVILRGKKRKGRDSEDAPEAGR